jgi:hypothetical protein
VRAHNDFRVVGIKESLKDSAALVLHIYIKKTVFFSKNNQIRVIFAKLAHFLSSISVSARSLKNEI